MLVPFRTPPTPLTRFPLPVGCLLLLLVTLQSAAAAAAPPDRAWVGFDRHGYGKWYNQWHAKRDFGGLRWFDNHNARLERPGILRIKLPRGRENLGFKAVSPVRPRAARTCVARLRFAKGFDFGRRNDIKLPCGLGGGTLPTGGNLDREGGFTARFVVIGSNRHLGVYAYHADQPRRYGEFFDTGIVARAGQWYTLKLHVKKNASRRRDGWLGASVNGRRRIGRSMRWSNRSRNVDTLFVTSFRGGSGDPPARDTFIEVDYIQVY